MRGGKKKENTNEKICITTESEKDKVSEESIRAQGFPRVYKRDETCKIFRGILFSTSAADKFSRGRKEEKCAPLCQTFARFCFSVVVLNSRVYTMKILFFIPQLFRRKIRARII